MMRFLLLYKIEWTDRHPNLMVACAGGVMLAGGILSKVLA